MFHVKHADHRRDSTLREKLAESAASLLGEMDIVVGADFLSACVAYLLEVLFENESVNVTAIRDPREALRLHVVDSLAALPDVLSAPSGPLCDVGSGGGFPGVPLCLASGREGVLLDSVGRKSELVARALAATASRMRESHLGVDLTGVMPATARAEEYALEAPAQFAVVTSRAVAELPVLVEYAAPLLIDRGAFVALKGSPSIDEIAKGRSAAEICGMTLMAERHYTLPAGGEARAIFVFERTSAPSIALPRGTGRASKRPLA